MTTSCTTDALRYNGMASSPTRPSPLLFWTNARWARRWPFMMVLVCYGFQPTAARKAVLLALNPPLPTHVKIPPIVMRTKAQRHAFLNMKVFGHEGIWRIIASYI